jgi:hypothetical protein
MKRDYCFLGGKKMGLFLAMSGIIGGNRHEVEEGLRKFAESRKGSLCEKRLATNDENCLVIGEGESGITVFYPYEYFMWDETSEFLSEELSKPVFSFHIHDGDFWMYQFFVNGEVMDCFNPVPDYWQDDIEEEESNQWQGNAQILTKFVPGVHKENVANYLKCWGDEVFESSERKKAYSDDEFFYGDDWQLTDFMKRLGLMYPLDEKGNILGTSYEYKCD